MPRRFRFVDALRGLAFLGVLFCHSVTWQTPYYLYRFGQLGANGVQLFFIVSAFTLSYSLKERSKNERKPVLNFFIRRFFRIAPLFWFALAASLYLDGFSARDTAPYGINWIDVISTFFFLHGWRPSSINSVVPGDWTIAVEMSFYCLLPLILRRIRNLNQSLWLCLIAFPICHVLTLSASKIILAHSASPLDSTMVASFFYFWLPSQIPVFCLGVALYFVLKDYLAAPQIALEKNKIELSQWMLGVSAYLLLASPFGGYSHIPGYYFCGIAFVFLSWSLAIRPISFLVNRFTCFLGKISYSCYLMHFFVFRFMFQYAQKFLADDLDKTHPYSYVAVKFTVGLALTMIVSFITYRIIEIPGINLGKRIINKWEKRPGPQPAAGTNW